MSVPLVSRKKANATFNGIFLIGLGLLFFTNSWWPGILLVIGTALTTRQYLRGRFYDMALSIIIFGGLFVGSLWNWDVSFLIPVLFTLAGIYLLVSEWGMKHDRVGEEEVEEIGKELDEDEHPS